jgi:hypothetical protein
MADGGGSPSSPPPPAAAAPLFGGALTARVPAGWLDASDVRPVPDNQEVWLADDASGASLVVELLEPPEGVPADGVAEYLLHDLAQAAGAPAAAVGAVVPLTRDAAPCLRCLEGTQGWRAVGTFTAAATGEGGGGGEGDAALPGGALDVAHEVAVALGVVRLPSPLDTDILVTVHAPVLPAGATFRSAPGHAGAAAAAVASALLDTLLASLQIVDFDLFMGGEGDGEGDEGDGAAPANRDGGAADTAEAR